MKNHLPIPSELQHLIEKREDEERRKDDRRYPADLETVGSPEPVDNLEEEAPEEHGSGDNRRHEERRRKTDRRKSEGNPPES